MFLHEVLHNKYIFFLSINGSRSSEATIIVENVVKNGRYSGRHLISQTKLVLLFKFYMWKIPNTKGFGKNANSLLLLKMLPKVLK